MSVLQIKNLTKTYPGGKVAVKDLSLDIEPGCVTGIIGFEKGEIYIDGISIKEDSQKTKSIIAYIPDNPDLYDYLTGIQYLNFIADVFEVDKETRNNRIEKYGKLFEIYGDLGSLISSYSHGMKQKLAIISALIHQPKLLILDEPFVGLDPVATIKLKEIMHELCSMGSAIFFSTHVLDVAEKLCNKIAIIKKGELIASGRIEELTEGKSLEDVFMEVVTNVK